MENEYTDIEQLLYRYQFALLAGNAGEQELAEKSVRNASPETATELIDGAKTFAESNKVELMTVYHFGKDDFADGLFSNLTMVKKCKEDLHSHALYFALQYFFRRGKTEYARTHPQPRMPDVLEGDQAAKMEARQRAINSVVNAEHDDYPEGEDDEGPSWTHKPSILPLPESEAAGAASPVHEYDVVIHTLGKDTNIPQYFCMEQFPAREHWFITSEASVERIDALMRIFPGLRHEIKKVDAFAVADTTIALNSIVNELPPTSRIGINLTGGTKLMFAGALQACGRHGNVEPLYFDIGRENIIFLNTGDIIPFKGVRTTENFFVASGYRIVTPGHWRDNPYRESRRKLTLWLWQHRKELGALYSTQVFRDYCKARNDKKKKRYGGLHSLNTADQPFAWEGQNGFAVSYGRVGNGFRATVAIGEKKIEIPTAGPDFGRYITGGWLEEYAYLRLEPLLKTGRIFDLRIGMEVDSYKKINPLDSSPVNECDCVFTDGRRLYIVECKAGNVNSEQVTKLSENVRVYGGPAGQGILLSSFQTGTGVMEQIRKFKNINSISDNDANDNLAFERVIIP